MGQLTNLYVSSSYQGLLKMTDSTNGLTNTLQTIQTGDGDNSPLQMSFTQVNISGSFSINNVPITNGTSGTSGTSGIAGSSGTSGSSGATGSSGTAGSSGTSGSDGTSGSSGTGGSDGTSGSSGTSGSNGTDGTSGSSGTSGVDGTSGSSGSSGTDGTSGTSGDSIFAQTGSYYNTTNDIGITGSLMIRSGSLSLMSNGTTVNTDLYLTSSIGGQSNIIKGWGQSPTSAGPASSIANYSGSVRITGSNNTVSLPQVRATLFGGGADLQGYISGSDNIIGSNQSGIYLNTGSLLFPKTQGNYLGVGAGIFMNFTTSSLAGGNPIIQNNNINGGQIQLNSNSGSITVLGNLLNGGTIQSNQNFVTNVRPQVSSNTVQGSTVTLNHISSSVNFINNTVNATVNINNAVSSSVVNNNSVVSFNTFAGSGPINIFISGSQNSNVTRNIVGNLMGGININVSSSFVSSSNSNFLNSIVYGNGLTVSGSHTTGGGSAYFGRFNDTGSLLNDAQQVVFALGTGTSAANRRTSLWVDSNGVTNVSGALSLQTANDAATGSLALMTARDGTQLWSYNKTTLNSSWGAQNNTFQVGGSFGLVSGSFSNAFYGGFAGQAFRSGSNNIMFNSFFDTFISGSSNLFIAQSNNGLAGGSGNVIIGPISYPSGSIVNNRFQINSSGGTNIMTKDASNALQINSDLQVTGSLRVTGDVKFASGSNKTMGTVALDGANPGSATISNSLVTANSLIFLTKQTFADTNSRGVAVVSKGTGTFTISSGHNGDTDVVAYQIINPA